MHPEDARSRDSGSFSTRSFEYGNFCNTGSTIELCTRTNGVAEAIVQGTHVTIEADEDSIKTGLLIVLVFGTESFTVRYGT